jgi:hypothetical protein
MWIVLHEFHEAAAVNEQNPDNPQKSGQCVRPKDESKMFHNASVETMLKWEAGH